jgi:large subunit ribosomal protein L22
MARVETPERNEVRAEARYVRTAPRKAQLVAEQIRGRTVPEARTILAFMTRDAARDVERVLSSAVANAEQNHGLDGDELYVAHAIVGAGPTLKRWRARARGRVARIKKRTCHISISLALPEGGVIPAPIAQPVPVAAPAPEPEVEETEETPKPKRAPRKKAEEAAPVVEAAPEAEEKPAEAEEKPETTRKRATTPKAEQAEADEKPKPKRTTTRKKKETES